MTATDTLERVETLPDTGEPIYTHIVAGTEDKTSIEVVMEARIYGTPVTALCGYTWVPSRDPQKHPLCSKCKEIRQNFRPDEDIAGIPT